VVSTDKAAMKAAAQTLDLLIDTVAAPHNLDPYLSALKREGTMVMVGAAAEPHPSPTVGLLMFRRRNFAGSIIGGIAETQEMLDFCADNGITADVERIAMADIETAYERMLKSDVKYRFVIDMATIDG
jgi:uncharacterized zinc-type alcohol dehydrogenase-like protein